MIRDSGLVESHEGRVAGAGGLGRADGQSISWSLKGAGSAQKAPVHSQDGGREAQVPKDEQAGLGNHNIRVASAQR